QPSADPVGALVAAEVVVGLQAEPVLDGDEVQQAALGLLGQADPVARREQPVRLRVRFSPGGGVPAGAVQRDGQVQGVRRGCHGASQKVVGGLSVTKPTGVELICPRTLVPAMCAASYFRLSVGPK